MSHRVCQNHHWDLNSGLVGSDARAFDVPSCTGSIKSINDDQKKPTLQSRLDKSEFDGEILPQPGNKGITVSKTMRQLTHPVY
ncbi:unnamed protein product [Protopolystoma xenopodis]|uniref:Uncharacterized protein n=1 Tax=Protopolystoma xenopodis TaxID=117903 RepID=A0A3S5CP58_9PLAT|nr:unnamed protein product [Protopolystoma xenopodis]